jgi:hypothetical protein
MKPTERRVFRCAIYTRKSTERNLDLEFNSLDAQREACEAYNAAFQSLFLLSFSPFFRLWPTGFDKSVRALAMASRASAACSTDRV